MSSRETVWATAAATVQQPDGAPSFERLAIRLAGLGELAVALQAARTIPAIHVALAGHARWLLDVTGCTLVLHDDSGSSYRVLATPGIDPAGAPRGWPGRGWTGWVLEHGKTVVAPLPRAPERFREDQQQGAVASSACSALYLPLQLGGTTGGVLVFASPNPRAYPAEVLPVAHLIQMQVAAAVENAQLIARLESAENVVVSLAHAVEAKDAYTEGHCRRLSEYGALLGAALGLGPGDCAAVARGGLLHDVGKIAIPESILLKPGRLTAEEFAIMQGHVEAGVRICAPLQSLRHALPVIRHHHEHFDGTGYPDGLCGEAIPVTARIIAVVDAYDAMTTTRPYRRALPVDQALAILRDNRGPQWDADIVNCFTSVLEERLSA